MTTGAGLPFLKRAALSCEQLPLGQVNQADFDRVNMGVQIWCLLKRLDELKSDTIGNPKGTCPQTAKALDMAMTG